MAAVLMSPETGLNSATGHGAVFFARCGGQRGQIIVGRFGLCNGFVGSLWVHARLRASRTEEPK